MFAVNIQASRFFFFFYLPLNRFFLKIALGFYPNAQDSTSPDDSSIVYLQIQAFMYGWLTFYHQVIARSFLFRVLLMVCENNSFLYKGHEVAKDFKPYMTDLQIRVQNVRCMISSEFAVLLPSLAFSSLQKTWQFLFSADSGKLQGEPR